MIFLLIMSGRIYEALKYLIKLITNILLKIANLCGIKIDQSEKRIHVSKEFKKTFQDIKVVKKSKQNNKIKPSINLIAAILLVISVTLIIANLEVVSGNAISTWLFDHNLIPGIISSQRNMDMTFTSILFSTVTFSISKILAQWKETGKYRKAKREMRKKQYLLKTMTAKDLLDIVKEKDLINYNETVKHIEENREDV